MEEYGWIFILCLLAASAFMAHIHWLAEDFLTKHFVKRATKNLYRLSKTRWNLKQEGSVTIVTFRLTGEPSVVARFSEEDALLSYSLENRMKKLCEKHPELRANLKTILKHMRDVILHQNERNKMGETRLIEEINAELKRKEEQN